MSVLASISLWRPGDAGAAPLFLGEVNEAASRGDLAFAAGATGDLLFRNFEPETGLELWTSDGTPSGTVMVRDIRPGPGSSSPQGFVVFRGETFFAADDGQHGMELWKTDGTTAGTTLVSDVNPGPNPSGPHSFAVARAIDGSDLCLYFLADDGQHGYELWKTDGTPSGAALVRDIRPGPMPCGAENPHDWWPRHRMVASVGEGSGEGVVYLWGDDGVHGRELWVSDGTTSGTRMVADLTTGSEHTTLGNLAILRETETSEGVLYFGDADLWRSDGTAEGTYVVNPLDGGGENEEVVDIAAIRPAGERPGALAVLVLADKASSNTLWFFDAPGLNESPPADLWKPIDSYASTYAPPAAPGAGERSRAFHPMTAADFLQVAGDGGPNPVVFVYGDELEPRGGTTPDSVGAKFYFISSYPSMGTRPSGMLEGEALAYLATKGILTSPDSLWVSDGTSSGTREVASIWPGGYDFLNDPLVGGGSPVGINLAVAEDIAAGTHRVWFTATDHATSYGLYTMAGPDDSPAPLVDLQAGTDSSTWLQSYQRLFGRGPRQLGQTMLFEAYTHDNGMEIWRTDADGPVEILKDIAAGPENSTASIDPRHVAGGLAYFEADDKVHGWELWRTDGTTDGTELFLDLIPGPDSSGVGIRMAGDLLETGEEALLLYAVDETSTAGLWLSDGTVEGTEKFFSGTFFGDFLGPVRGADGKLRLIATGNTYAEGFEPWVTDLTTSGTHLLLDIMPGAESSGPTMGWLHTISDNGTSRTVAIFRAQHPDLGRVHWETDGTTSGTRVIEDFTPPPPDDALMGPGVRFEMEDWALEAVDTEQHWRWLNDSVIGAHQIDAVAPGGIRHPLALVNLMDAWVMNGRPGTSPIVCFEAFDVATGIELWTTDGTPEGTRVHDVEPGPGSGLGLDMDNHHGNIPYPYQGTTLVSGQDGEPDRLYFWADDGVHGLEVWMLEADGAPPVPVTRARNWMLY